MRAHAYHFRNFALGQQQFFYLAQKSPRLILKDIEDQVGGLDSPPQPAPSTPEAMVPGHATFLE